MNDFLQHQYQAARQTSLHELAQMQNRNDEYAEKNGGIDNLPDAVRRAYEARKNTLIRIVAYHDRTQEYIEDLQEWIGQLIQENRRLADQVRDADRGWMKYFPNITNPNQTESDIQHRRYMSITRLQLEMPNLF